MTTSSVCGVFFLWVVMEGEVNNACIYGDWGSTRILQRVGVSAHDACCPKNGQKCPTNANSKKEDKSAKPYKVKCKLVHSGSHK